MTYSLDFRKQALRLLNEEGMSYRKVASLFNVSTRTLQNWQQNIDIKPTKDLKPKKIDDEALLKDVESYPYDYLYERARRFNCTDMGIYKALKRLGVTRKKTKEYTLSQTSSKKSPIQTN